MATVRCAGSPLCQCSNPGSYAGCLRLGPSRFREDRPASWRRWLLQFHQREETSTQQRLRFDPAHNSRCGIVLADGLETASNGPSRRKAPGGSIALTWRARSPGLITQAELHGRALSRATTKALELLLIVEVRCADRAANLSYSDPRGCLAARATLLSCSSTAL